MSLSKKHSKVFSIICVFAKLLINFDDFINKHNEEDRYFIIGTDSQNDKI
jgi:hypothetical protein